MGVEGAHACAVVKAHGLSASRAVVVLIARLPGRMHACMYVCMHACMYTWPTAYVADSIRDVIRDRQRGRPTCAAVSDVSRLKKRPMSFTSSMA